MATEGGSELVTHNAQILLDANPNWVLLQTEMSNAFNSVSRSHLLNQVTGHFPEILRHCSLAIQSILEELQTNHDKVIYLAYLDDISILGLAEHVIDAGIALKNALLPINLLQISSNTKILKQAMLPIKLEGFGLTSAKAVSPASYLARWAHFLSILPERFPKLHMLTSQLLNGIISNSIHNNLCRAAELISGKQDVVKLWDNRVHFSTLHKLQQKICSGSHSRSVEDFLKSSSTNNDVACFRSVRGRRAGAWLQAIPTYETLALEPGKFRLAASLRLGAQLPFEDWGLVCDCGKEGDNYHLLTYKMGGSPVWEHDEIVAG